jgi:Protein of unknown function (DUF4236)
MSWRFRKRLRIIPGVWINLSKKGGSLSVGGHGLTANISKKGVRETVGLPGTGISYQTKRIWPIQRHESAKGRRQSVSPLSVLAFVLGLAAVLWLLAHLH